MGCTEKGTRGERDPRWREGGCEVVREGEQEFAEQLLLLLRIEPLLGLYRLVQ